MSTRTVDDLRLRVVGVHISSASRHVVRGRVWYSARATVRTGHGDLRRAAVHGSMGATIEEAIERAVLAARGIRCPS